MKKYTFAFLTLAFALVITINSFAQTVSRNASGYSGIECNGPFNVSIKIDGTESIKLDVDANILNDIKTEVENGVLKIGLKNGWKKYRNVKHANIYITAKNLKSLSNGGSGNVELDGMLTGDRTKITLSGSGDLKTSIKSNMLDMSVSGSGSIHVNGSINWTNVSISGSGEINGKGLKTDVTNANISGSGGISIIANKTVSASISGSGGVDYSGNATIGNTHYSGSGRINKVD